MTVKELIEKLSEFDPDADVNYYTKVIVEDNGFKHSANKWKELEAKNVFKAKIGKSVFIGD